MASKVIGLIEFSGLMHEMPQGMNYFKQFNIQETLTIPESKPDISQIVSVTAEAVIKSKYIIKTAQGLSYENKNLTGRKLIVEGVISQKVEYIADELSQSVHTAHFNMPFCAYIIIPSNVDLETHFTVTGYIEDIHLRQLNKRQIFKNLTILLDAKN